MEGNQFNNEGYDYRYLLEFLDNQSILYYLTNDEEHHVIL